MDRRARTSRFVLAFAYAALTVWAAAGDRHGHEAPTEAQCSTNCLDPSPHLSGHSAPDLSHPPQDCPACQSRSSLHVEAPQTPALVQPIGSERLVWVEIDSPRIPARSVPSCRAPPSA